MKIVPLRLSGTFEIIAAPIHDERGYFQRAYDQALMRELGLQTNWVQENQSFSARKHIIRGLHFQRPPSAETKLVRAVQGAVWDVFVDLRNDSPTYGQWDAIELAADMHNMVYIPRGFAHGFCTLTESCLVQYKVDSCYAPGLQGGLRWCDPTLDIDWPTDSPLLSPRDRELGFFKDFVSPFLGHAAPRAGDRAVPSAGAGELPPAVSPERR
jgi:dTDP-4-dehydrorhamnose 3,5-epimerase